MSNLPPDITSGFLRAYFIYDVADSIKLSHIGNSTGAEYQKAELKLVASPAPSHIQFAVAPLVAPLPDCQFDGRNAEVRVKLYDYGTIALRLSFPFEGKWQDFARLTAGLKSSDALQKQARVILDKLVGQLEPFLLKPHDILLEDYFVGEVQQFAQEMTASALLQNHRTALASMVAAEERPLSPNEQNEVLKVNYSYMECELAILTWDLAFVFDTAEGADSVDAILEFANTQLVELRTYDRLLDRCLDEIYKSKAESMRSNWLIGGKVANRQAERLRHLLVDVRELSDRAENALKIIGDAYYARLYRGIAGRLSLSEWQHQVENKLSDVGEIYRFTHDQAEHGRSEFLEFTVIALISIEILMNVFLHH